MSKQKKGLVPELRFPEFRTAQYWRQENLGSKRVSSFVKKRISAKELDLNTYISTENILPDYSGVSVSAKLPSSGSFTEYSVGDVLISNIRPYLKKIWQADRCGASSNDVIVVRAGDDIYPSFLSYILKSDAFINYVMEGAKGVKMPRGDISSMRKYPVFFPSVEEQQKIADCLASTDELLTLHAQKLGSLKDHKISLMQQLFPSKGETAPKLRFPEFQGSGEWKPRVLGKFLRERNQIPREKVPLYSLTIEDGVSPKTERYERSFLVKNESEAYKLVKPLDFAYNPMNLRFGAIGMHSGSEDVAVSKYYNIFHCDDTVDARFCEIYFKSAEMITHYNNVATGSLIEKRRVYFSDFLRFKIPFPSLDEQKKIAQVIDGLTVLIDKQYKKVESLKEHKKGLMQKLFPVTDDAV